MFLGKAPPGRTGIQVNASGVVSVVVVFVCLLGGVFRVTFVHPGYTSLP